jgi:putative methionine-R-sulfoxide reductase with GAF domain
VLVIDCQFAKMNPVNERRSGYPAGMASSSEKSRLAQRLGDLAVEMETQRDAESVLRAIVNGAVGIIPGARWAGISLIHGREIEPRVPSDPLVTKLDAVQSELDQGPCIAALREHHTVHVADMSQQTSWPEFAEAAMTLGVRSSLSFQLFVRSDNLGALNLYGDEPNAFDDDSFFDGEILAQHSSVAISGSQVVEQMNRAIASRDLIGQAKGILMERFDIDAPHAFNLLTRLSQDSNTKLLTIATRVVETHGAHGRDV